MAEYIEREAVRAMIKHRLGTLDLFESRFNADLNAIPAADVVEVVWCKDCKHWSSDCGVEDRVCLKIYSDGQASMFAWQERKPDDFCSYGERRSDHER